jgi:hypothetical protein
LIPDVGPRMVFCIMVLDYDMFNKDELIGEYEIVLDPKNEEAAFLRDSSESFPLSASLLPPRKKGGSRKLGKPHGDVKLTMQYTPFFNAQAPPVPGATGENDPAKAIEMASV